jgi:hypothetical protein
MGLDSVIMFKNPETGEYKANIPENIVEKILSNCINIIGISSCVKPNYISFKGKTYNYAFNKISKYSLYQDIDTIKLHIIHQKFKKFNENTKEHIIELNKIYESNNSDINFWFEKITDEYIPSPIEIIQLEKLFAICIEYELMIYASY